jgi:hypothetical protein
MPDFKRIIKGITTLSPGGGGKGVAHIFEVAVHNGIFYCPVGAPVRRLIPEASKMISGHQTNTDGRRSYFLTAN